MERMERWLSVVFQKHIVGVYVRKSKWFIKLLAGLGWFGFGNMQRSSSWTGSVCVEFGLGQERERNVAITNSQGFGVLSCILISVGKLADSRLLFKLFRL